MAEPLDSETRKKIILGVLLVATLAYLGYERFYVPRSAELAELETRLETLRMQNQTARILTEQQGRGEVERQLAASRQLLVRVEGLIPSSEELPDLLDAISAEAQRTGVELALIQPVGATEEGFYTRRVYELAVVGSYHSIAAFLSEVASLPRIVTPTTLRLTVKEEGAGAEPRLEAKFAIETYVLPTELPVDTTHAE